MEEPSFRRLLTDHLVPMLAGTELGEARPSSPRQELVAYEHPCALVMKPSGDSDYRIQLLRTQAFTPEEKRLVGLFVEELAAVAGQSDAAHFPDLMSAIPRRVISKLLPRNTGRGTLEQAIR